VLSQLSPLDTLVSHLMLGITLKVVVACDLLKFFSSDFFGIFSFVVHDICVELVMFAVDVCMGKGTRLTIAYLSVVEIMTIEILYK